MKSISIIITTFIISSLNLFASSSDTNNLVKKGIEHEKHEKHVIENSQKTINERFENTKFSNTELKLNKASLFVVLDTMQVSLINGLLSDSIPILFLGAKIGEENIYPNFFKSERTESIFNLVEKLEILKLNNRKSEYFRIINDSIVIVNKPGKIKMLAFENKIQNTISNMFDVESALMTYESCNMEFSFLNSQLPYSEDQIEVVAAMILQGITPEDRKLLDKSVVNYESLKMFISELNPSSHIELSESILFFLDSGIKE